MPCPRRVTERQLANEYHLLPLNFIRPLSLASSESSEYSVSKLETESESQDNNNNHNRSDSFSQVTPIIDCIDSRVPSGDDDSNSCSRITESLTFASSSFTPASNCLPQQSSKMSNLTRTSTISKTNLPCRTSFSAKLHASNLIDSRPAISAASHQQLNQNNNNLINRLIL